MDFGFTEEQNRFRQEVRSFLEQEIEKGTGNPPAMPGYKSLTLSLPNGWRTEAG
jgi:hypothetical protein